MRLCVIPARGGSKRIPRKNVKMFHGKPIIAYSIEAALKSNCFDHVVVSTDDSEIAEVATKYGAEIPFMRPADLANDYAGTLPVIRHAVEWYKKNGSEPSDICCLYATAPFISNATLRRAFEQFQHAQSDYCFSVARYAFPIQRALKFTSDNRVEMFNPEHFNSRSQDLEPAYHDAGQFYWGKADAFRMEKPIFSTFSSPFLLADHLVQDIDTEEDWKRAELMYQTLLQAGEIC